MSRPVLVIDDNADARVLTARILRKLGEEAVCVTGGREAIEYLRGHERPKLVLLDLHMPEVGGMEVLAFIRQRPDLAGVPVVVFSASDEVELRAALTRGANDYLRKGSVGLDDFRRRINRFAPPPPSPREPSQQERSTAS